MSLHQKVYRFRLRPTKAQEEALYRFAGARRFVYNWGLARRKEAHEQTGKGLTYFQQTVELTQFKKLPDYAWLKDTDSQALQEALRDVEKAFRNFFEKRSGFPRFKSKRREIPSFRITQRVRIEGSKVRVPKVGWVKLHLSQPVDCPTKSATFKRDALGHWYVSLIAVFGMPDLPLPPARAENVIGVDLGLKDFAVLSNGERITPPKYYRAAQKKLRRAQRKHSRRQLGSKNRDKARHQVAKIHRQIANKRQDFLHKLTTSLVREYDGLCIEDLSLKGMARTKLSKSVLDAGLGEFRRQLEYKSVWNRKHFTVIDRWFPSSKLHSCGYKNEALTLNDRSWTCGCGALVDRDLNAAQNIRTEGLRLLEAAGHVDSLNACGGDVRHPLVLLPLKQETDAA